MSHFSRIKTQFKELKYLEKAIKDLGYTYQEGEQEIGGFGRQKTRVDIRIPLPLSYDIGLRRSGDNYEIIADWFGVRGITREDFTNKLTQRYAYHATRDKMEQQGFNLVEEKIEGTGEIRIVLRRMA